ncbi:MAG: SPOR domain-containing protein [Gammaproteobacteria bacterium]|nr:SPOR domain-containing protein [Gammaproteobacteria bacterium]
MAKRKTRRKTRSTRRTKKNSQSSGFTWGLFGLAIGLSVAAAIYVKDRELPSATSAAPTSSKVTESAPETRYGLPEKKESRFKFYDMLPKFEVVIPEEDTVVRRDARPEPLKDPGIYVLQAGSFSSNPDADRMKAQLAMLGIESRIQKVSVDDKTYHRVRIGPIDSLDKLNDLRGQLRQSKIDVMVIRVGDQ